MRKASAMTVRWRCFRQSVLAKLQNRQIVEKRMSLNGQRLDW
jgi:hypothetical protein